MSSNPICEFFDRTVRRTRSATNLFHASMSQRSATSLQESRPKSRESLSVRTEHEFSQRPRPSTYPLPLLPTTKIVIPHRAGTTPLIHPPDELFLSMIRRRSANAQLEQHCIPNQYGSPVERYRKGELPTPVAVACALPPQYFDLLPEYESPQQTQQKWFPPPPRSRSTILTSRGAELFIEDDLRIQIDQTIADFGGFSLTEATPVRTSTPESQDHLVSPINEIDTMYLERRAERKRQERWLYVAAT